MCNFLSAIVLRNGDIITDPEHTDSHSTLISAFGLRDDDAHIDRFVKVEFTPATGKDGRLEYDNPAGYALTVDERGEPEWFAEFRERIIASLRSRIERMIVRDKRETLLGGCWILTGNAEVGALVSARVREMRDSSWVGVMRDSSRVGEMWDSSWVGEMLNSSQVGKMLNSSRVGVMRDSSQVGVMRDSSQVGKMLDSSRVGEMWDSSWVGEMRDSSRLVRDKRIEK